MRLSITFLFLCCSSILFAQGPRGGSQGNQIPKIETEKIAGIHNYDVDKVLKKLKINKKDTLEIPVRKALTAYNAQLSKIGADNKDLFEGLDVVVQMNIETAVKNKDRETLINTMKMAREKLSPIVLEVKEKENELNRALETALPEDGYKKWEKYQKTEREKRIPKMGGPQRGNNRSPRGGRPR